MQTPDDPLKIFQRRLCKAATLTALSANLAFGGNLAAAQPTAVTKSRSADLDAAVGTLDPVRAHLEQLREREIKSLYRNCSRKAIERRLGSGEIAQCSVVYEVLLGRHFRGNFRAFLTWSRAEVD